jgi:hypothetical protein
MLPAAAFTIALTVTAAQPVQKAPPRPADIAPEFRLKGDVVSIPFVMVREFPFVKARVGGVEGKLLLDTGAPDALSLNHNHLKLPEGRVIGLGRFGSGQIYEEILRPSVDDVSLAGGLNYGHISNYVSQDAA